MQPVYNTIQTNQNQKMKVRTKLIINLTILKINLQIMKKKYINKKEIYLNDYK